MSTDPVQERDRARGETFFFDASKTRRLDSWVIFYKELNKKFLTQLFPWLISLGYVGITVHVREDSFNKELLNKCKIFI